MPSLTNINRSVLDGFLRYIREKKTGLWNVQLGTSPILYISPSELQQNHIDGIIAYVDSTESANQFLALDKFPMMLLAPTFSKQVAEKIASANPRIAIIRTDFQSEGAFAARYLLSRNLKNFVFVGDVSDIHGINAERYKGFRKEIIDCRFPCDLYVTSAFELIHGAKSAKWLASLKTGTGLFAASDILAKNLLEAMRAMNISVPRDVSVLGIDNDELICNTSVPQLSSISANIKILGYEVAKLFDNLVENGVGGLFLSSNRLEVIARASTEIYATGDFIVHKALQWIDDNASRSIGVSSVANAIGHPVKSLQRRFQTVLGHTVGSEIKQRKIQLAMSLIKTSHKSINAIADICGFSSPSHLCKRIREQTGYTPNEFRKQIF